MTIIQKLHATVYPFLTFALVTIKVMSQIKDVNIDVPRWDQSTYIGRAKHFFTVTNPLNLFYSSQKLDEARDIVIRHR